MSSEHRLNKHILLHRPTPWLSDINCSTKIYAKQFKKAGYKVTYLENPLDPGHLIKWKGYYHVWRRAPRWEDGIWIINPFSIVPIRDHFLFRSTLTIDASYYSCIPRVKSLVRRSGQGDPDVIWTAKPGSSVLKEIFPKATLIFQVVDYYPAFRGDYIKAIEKRDYERADHIFLIGHSLVEYVTHELCIPADKITVLGQGVSLDLYNQVQQEPEDIKAIPRPRAIWVGVLDKGDSALFEAAAKELQQQGGSLILVGPEAEWARHLIKKFDNIYLLGSRPSKNIPSYLVHSDFGLMLYSRTRQNIYHGQNPLKLYEYAAAGLPIISTPHEEFKFLKPPVIQVNASEDIPLAINSAIKKRPEWQRDVLDFVAPYSWESCFKRAEGKIFENLNSGMTKTKERRTT